MAIYRDWKHRISTTAETKALPRKEKWLIQVVVDTDNQIVIGNTVNLWPRKLPIYQDSLQNYSKEHIFIQENQ